MIELDTFLRRNLSLSDFNFFPSYLSTKKGLSETFLGLGLSFEKFFLDFLFLLQ